MTDFHTELRGFLKGNYYAFCVESQGSCLIVVAIGYYRPRLLDYHVHKETVNYPVCVDVRGST